MLPQPQQGGEDVGHQGLTQPAHDAAGAREYARLHRHYRNGRSTQRRGGGRKIIITRGQQGPRLLGKLGQGSAKEASSTLENLK